MKKPCLQCKETICKRVNCSVRQWNERVKFCSKGCRDDYRRGKPSLSPETSFQKGHKPSEKTISLSRKRFTGSSNPRWKGGNIELSCVICNARFRVQPYRKDTAKCCSRTCVTAYWKTPERRMQISNTHKARVKKGLHNTHIDGKSKGRDKKIRHSLKYRLWREEVFKRDDFTCQICGVRGGVLNADHILPFATFPEHRFELSNGRTLCEDCHKSTETWGMTRATQLVLQVNH